MSERPNKKRRPEYRRVPVSDLLFDPSNPRFGGEPKKLTLPEIEARQEAIQKRLEEAPHYALQLLDSFRANGFIPYEPLVVRELGSKHIVIEGNRRLAAARHILANKDQQFSQGEVESFKEIPVLIFHQSSGQSDLDEIRAYLGVRHLFGFRDWPPESKAKFLDEQIKTKADIQRLVHELGVSRHTIKRYLVPYRVTRSAKKLLGSVQDQDFWILGEALTRSAIADYIELKVDPDTYKVEKFNRVRFRKLIEYLYGKVDKDTNRRLQAQVTETRQLSKLAIALAGEKSSRALEKGKPLSEAILLVETARDSIKRTRRLVTEVKLLIDKLGPSAKNRRLYERALTTHSQFDKAVRRLIRDVQANI